MSRRKAILKDAGIYTLGTYASQLFDMVNGVLIRRYLGPAQMGLWSFLQVILSYLKHASLGVSAATSRDVPYYLGKGDLEKARETQSLVFTFTLLNSVMTALGLLAFVFLTRGRYPTLLFHGFLSLCVILVLQRVHNFLVTLLRAYKEFALAAFLNVSLSAAALGLTVLLTRPWGLYGFFAANILNYFFSIGLVFLTTRHPIRWLWDWVRIQPIMRFGFAMLAYDVLRSFLVSIDRLMITKFLGFEALGLYSVATMASTYAASFPTMLAVILFPHIQEAYGKRDQASDVGIFLLQPTLALSALMPFLIGAIWIFSDAFVAHFLPRYEAGIPALKFLILGVYFFAHTHNYTASLIALRKHWTLIPLTIFSAGFVALLTWSFIRMGWGLEGVALANLLLWVFNYAVLCAITFRSGFSLRRIVRMHAQLLGIFLYFTVLLLIYERVVEVRNFTTSFLACACYFLTLSPLLYLFEKQSRGISLGFQWLGRKVKFNPLAHKNLQIDRKD